MSSSLVRRSATAAALAGLAAASLAASEVSALHLEFERPVPMRRAAATLYLSAPGGQEAEASVLCAVLTAGKRGGLDASGELRLRLLGETSGAAWQSSTAVRGLDDRGEAGLTSEELAALAGEAPAGALIEWVEAVWRGGRGKKVATVTIDCLLGVGE